MGVVARYVLGLQCCAQTAGECVVRSRRADAISAMVNSICFVVTTPFAVNAFLLTHLKALADRWAVTLCVNRALYPLSDRIDPRIRVIDLPIARNISPLNDLRALFFLMAHFRAERYTAVHSITPKAGLLAMVAAHFTGVRLRHHTFTGQVWATRRGLSRVLLKAFDRVIVRAASQVFADSPSQCRFLEVEQIVRLGGISILGPGSISGVDIGRFRPDEGGRRRTRLEQKTGGDVCVFLFVGRLTKDKGIFDLVRAMTETAKANSRVELWLVGPDEERLWERFTQEATSGGARLRWLGQTTRPEDYMAAADVLVLPSYREGFGSVVIEAAACGIPTIAYRVDGVIDAVAENQTGLLVESGDVKALAMAMVELSRDVAGRRQMGKAALDRAVTTFASEAVTVEWVKFYERMVR